MAAKIDAERQGELLTLRIKGRIGFAKPDFQMRDSLVTLLREHIGKGTRHLLIDFSQTSCVFPSSFALVVEPLFPKDIVGDCRIAVCFKGNVQMRNRFSITHIDKVLDCFDTEEKALKFLQSDTPMAKDIKRAES